MSLRRLKASSPIGTAWWLVQHHLNRRIDLIMVSPREGLFRIAYRGTFFSSWDGVLRACQRSTRYVHSARVFSSSPGLSLNAVLSLPLISTTATRASNSARAAAPSHRSTTRSSTISFTRPRSLASAPVCHTMAPVSSKCTFVFYSQRRV